MFYTPGSDRACSDGRGGVVVSCTCFPQRWQPFWAALICEHSEKYQSFSFLSIKRETQNYIILDPKSCMLLY